MRKRMNIKQFASALQPQTAESAFITTEFTPKQIC